MLLAQTCNNIGKEFGQYNTRINNSTKNSNFNLYSQNSYKKTGLTKQNNVQSAKNEIMNTNLLSLEKMSNRIPPDRNSVFSKSPLSTASSSSSTISNEHQRSQQHNFTPKIVNNNNKNSHRSKPYSTTTGNKKNKSTSPSPTSSTNSSLTSSPTSANPQVASNNFPTHPVFPYDPLVMATIQKYYEALASSSTSNSMLPPYQYNALTSLAYNNALNGFLSHSLQQQQTSNYSPTATTNCSDQNYSKCLTSPLSPSNESKCTIPGCNQCASSKHLNVSTLSNSNNNNSLTNSPIKTSTPQQQLNNHYCNWLVGGNVYCGKKFTTVDELNEHIKTHTTTELVSELTRYYNIRSSLLNNNQQQITSPYVHSSNQSNKLNSNRVNPYSKPNTSPIINQTTPYLAYNPQNLPQLLTNPSFNFYSQLALLTNNI